MTKWRVVYTLEGKSRLAMQALRVAADNFEAAHPVAFAGKTYPEIQELEKARKLALREHLEKTQPEAMATLGLDKGAVQIWGSEPGGLPRAYRAWPEPLFEGFGQKFYLFVPVDHHGNTFLPQDATPMTAEDAKNFSNFFFAFGGDDESPILSFTEEGVALPADFDPATSIVFQRTVHDVEKRGKPVFQARGQSLAAIEHFYARNKARDKALLALQEHVRKCLPTSIDTPQQAGLMVYPVVNIREGGYGEPVVSVILRSATNSAAVPVPAQGAAYVVDKKTGIINYEVSIVPNPDSEAGRLFEKMLIDPVLGRPHLSEYPALMLPDAGGVEHAPLIQEYCGVKYLLYPAATRDGGQTPADAAPVTRAAARWLEQDDFDRGRGVSPPPVPDAIAAEIADLTGGTKTEPRGSRRR